jgi:large subunit ribosomal protein L22
MSAEEDKDTAAETPVEEPTAQEAKASAQESEASEKPGAEAKAQAEKAPEEKEPARRKPARAKKAAAGKEPKAAGKEPKAAEQPAAPAEKAPARRKPQARSASRRRVVRAHARYVRTSARKARMVCGHLRGKSVQEARAILAFTPREVAGAWSKLLESAVANAETNHELVEDDLIVREAYADEGPTIKRFRPRAMGRATPIRKRTSHLTITLTTGSEQRATNRRS